MDSVLYRDFPSTIGLSREDLEELLGRPEHQQQAQQGSAQQGLDASDAYLEAFVDSLPEVRALFDEHARLLKESEAKAGEWKRQGQSGRSSRVYGVTYRPLPVTHQLAI